MHSRKLFPSIPAMAAVAAVVAIPAFFAPRLLSPSTAEPVPTPPEDREAEVLELVGVHAAQIPRHTAQRHLGPDPIVIDGNLDESAWQSAVRSPPFVDLITGKPVKFDTRAAVLWDDTCLYVAYWIEETDVRATLQQRDAPVYSENDVELFIDGGGGYYEFEINALGTLYEAFFVWEGAYDEHYALLPGFRRDQPGVIGFNGVGFNRHPRGSRLGFMRWDFPGLRSAVRIDGTLNDSTDTDKGWTVELALPWKGMTPLAADGRALPPRDGDTWRLDFSRFNQYPSSDDPASNGSKGWAWSRHGVWDSHIPECFVHVTFATDQPTGPTPATGATGGSGPAP